MGLGEYFLKMKGEEARKFKIGLRGLNLVDVLWAWFGAALGIGMTAALSIEFFEPRDSVLIIGSFGASAVLVYGAIRSPLAQPRNLIGGHLISAAIGVASLKLVGDNFVAAGLGVSLAIAAMTVTDTLHPPGGATALIAVIGGGTIHDLGFFYILIPAGLGALLLLLVALVVNNIPKRRRYPLYWA